MASIDYIGILHSQTNAQRGYCIYFTNTYVPDKNAMESYAWPSWLPPSASTFISTYVKGFAVECVAKLGKERHFIDQLVNCDWKSSILNNNGVLDEMALLKEESQR